MASQKVRGFIIAAALLLHLAAACAATLGVTYNPMIPNLPPPEKVVANLRLLGVAAVRLLHPTPAVIRAFAGSNISVLISLPNKLIPIFAGRPAAATLWVYSHILPYHRKIRISLISAGADAISAAYSDPSLDPSAALLPAMRNLRRSLDEFGIRDIPVSTALSFVEIMNGAFPPSSAEFQEPIGSLVIWPLLQFLEETNSSFLINIYPSDVYVINPEIPVGFALFQDHRFNYRDDAVTGIRYRNLFDMMVDSLSSAMAAYGKQNISLVVSETGWPRNSPTGKYQELYLKGLVKHLKSGLGNSRRKQRVVQAYIYQLFDENPIRNNTNIREEDSASARRRRNQPVQNWGIMYPNMKMKYNFQFSSSSKLLIQLDSALPLLACVYGVLLILNV